MNQIGNQKMHVGPGNKKQGNAIIANSAESKAIELSIQRYSIFNYQDIEKGHFDVTFLFENKKLHAHSFVLWSASDVFEAMLCGSWKNPDPIPIKKNTWEDFKEFLTFFYLGQCDINMNNVMTILDLAESYHVPLLKEKCDEFLKNLTPTAETVFKYCEILKLYSMQNALQKLYDFIGIKAEMVLKNKAFLKAKKEIILDIVKMDRLVIKEEDLFDAVHKWAEYQHQQQETENSLSVKELLTDILPRIRFPVMGIEYLHEKIVPLGHLFSSFGELSQILKDADKFGKGTLSQAVSKYSHVPRKGWNLEFDSDRHGKAYAYVPKDVIKSIAKNLGNFCSSNYSQYDHYNNECFWRFSIPSHPSNKALVDAKECKFYVIRSAQGNFGLKNYSIDESHAAQERRNFNPYYAREFNQMDNEQTEHEIITRVYPKNNSFDISDGCTVKII